MTRSRGRETAAVQAAPTLRGESLRVGVGAALGLALALSAQSPAPAEFELIEPVAGVAALRAGDLDGDGDVDVVLAGAELTWRENAGDGSWRGAPRAFGLADAARAPAPTVADLDGDGDLDVIGVGPTPAGFRLFRNDGSGAFRDDTPALVGLGEPHGRAVVADLDGDRAVEVLLPTRVGVRVLAWRAGGFVDRSAGLFPGGAPVASAIAVGDVDGDGRVDLVLAGDANRADAVLLGSPRGFTAAAFGGLRPAGSVAVELALADLDRDGDLDLVLAEPGGVAVFDRTGTTAFTRRAPRLDDQAIDAAVVDLDGDGDVDIVSIGRGAVPQVWRNDGGGGFVRDVRVPVAPPRGSSAALTVADVDGRHGVDLIFARATTELWLASPRGGYVRAAGPDVGVDFAVRGHDAADVDGDGDVDVVGVRDAIGGPQMVLGRNDGTGRMTWAPLPGPVAGRLAFADVDGDGDADLLAAVGGAIGAPFALPDLLLTNDGTGVFTDDSVARLPQLREGSNRLVVGDVDGDGDVDAILVGTRPVLLRNDGTGRFTEVPRALPGGALIATDGAFADLDGDGDLDFAIAYPDPFFGALFVWRNDGTARFVDVANPFPRGFAARAREIEAGDVDGDGDIDLVLGNDGAADEWLENDGTGRFTVAHPLPGPASGGVSDARLCDVDGDGDLDWLSARPEWVLAHNDGRGGFTRVPLSVLASGRRMVIADLDRDGDRDVLGETALLLGRGLHLAVPRPARTGALLAVRLAADAGAVVPAAAVLSPAGLVAPTPIPGVGTLRVRPGLTLALPATTLPSGGAPVDVLFPIPNDPRLVGLRLGFQAAYVLPAGLRLGNALERDVVF